MNLTRQTVQRILRLSTFGTLFLLIACGSGGGSSGGGTPAPNPTPTRVTFAGVGAIGIFDPSVVEDPATGRLWMSYSEVSVSANSSWGVGLRLAYSDNGQTWQDAGIIQAFTDVTVGPLAVTSPEPAIPANSPGTWQSETSTLVYDANATANERWKILYHQILWANNYQYFASYSWMAMKAAATPQGLAAATQVKLFGGSLLKSDGEMAGAPAFSPIAGPPRFTLHTTNAALNNCLTFGEPGILATSAGLYLALDCQFLNGSAVEPYTNLFRCTYPGCDLTASSGWSYINRVTTPSDAQAIDSKYKGLNATAFVEKAGNYYLIATPVVTSDSRYDGCRVYRFTDLATGALQRSAGTLVTVQQVNGIAGEHHGACAHHAKLKRGIIYSQFVTPDAPTAFQIFQSGIDIP